MGGRGGASGATKGGENSSKLSSMSSEQREDFMAAYNLAGKEFKDSHTLNQAYDAAIERYRQFGGSRTGDSAAVKGMEFLQQDISEARRLQNSKRHEELRQEYLKLLPRNSAGKAERQAINLMPISTEALEQKIKRMKKK